MKRTNRILPVYSADISGVCSALYELGGMTVMHDASGCNSTYTTHDEPRWYSMDSMVYISALSELEAVMGDDEKLVRDIVDAANNLHPRFVCMGGTPIPMMMGTDFRGLARMIERETGIPAFGIDTNGMHSYIRGAGEALAWIARRFCPSAEELLLLLEQREKQHEEADGCVYHGLPVNILGATPLDFSLTGNIANMKLFLGLNGIDVVSCWAMESSLDELQLSGIAKVNLVISAAGLPAAHVLKELYGIPYVVGTPVGRWAARRVVELIKAAAGTGMDQVLTARSGGKRWKGGTDGTDGPDSPDAEAPDYVDRHGLPQHLEGKRILIVGEQIIANSIRVSLMEDLDADQVAVLCPMEGEAEYAEDGDILFWDEDEVIEQIGRSAIVIADPLYRQVCPKDKQVIFVDFPHEACSGRMYHEIMKPFVYIK